MRILYHPRRKKVITTTTVKYGYLYNWYAATDARNIAPAGWHVPTQTEFTTLRTNTGGYDYAGGKLKEIGFTHWGIPNTGATNEYGFNLRGSGYRFETGIFDHLKINAHLWSITQYDLTSGYYLGPINYNYTYCGINASYKKIGFPIRLIKDTSTDTGTMTGNDGKVYPTVKIGAQVWMAANLMETKYRDGDTIPTVTDNTTWAGLTTGAKCAYNNDESNVME